MKIITKENKEVDTLTDVICDLCGKSCKTEYGMEYMSLSTNWGYMSKHDLERWEADLCEECVETKLSFVPFKKTFYL